MKDKSKKLTVVNTGKKPTPESVVTKEAVLVKGAGLPVNMSDYLLKTIWEKVFEVRTTEDGVEYLFCKVNWVSQYGITTYADGDKLDLPGIYDGLPIDNQTLYWVTDENGKKVMLKAKGGGSGEGGGIEYPLTWSGYSSGSWNGSETKNIYIPSKVSELTNDSLFIKLSDLDLYIEQGGYITDSALSDYLPKSGGTITGNLSIDGAYAFMPMDSSGYGFYFAGQNLNLHKNHIYERPILNLDSSYNVVFATTPLVKNVGNLATHSWVGANYLPLKGGTITGDLYINAPIITNSGIKGKFWEIKDLDGNPYLKLIHHGNWFIQGYDGYLYLGMGAAKSLKIDSSGNGDFVGRIGCVGSINVSGLSGANTSVNIYSYDNSGFQFSNRITESGQLRIYYRNSGGIFTSLFELSKTGNLLVTGLVTFQGTSDKRLKQNIRTFSASEELMKLGGVYQFEYVEDEVKRNEKYQGTHFGLIYQNVKESSLSKMCMEREDGFGALNYLDTSFISLLAAVGMEHETRLQKLERENRELRMEVEQLKNK